MAARKLAPLLEAGAAVTVIAPALDPRCNAQRDARQLGRAVVARRRCRPRPPAAVVGRRGDRGCSGRRGGGGGGRGARRVVRACRRARVRRAPGVVRDGPVVAALTTGAPALTAALRDRVAEAIAGSGPAAALLADLRDRPDVRTALAALDPATAAPGGRRRRCRAVATPAPADRIRSCSPAARAHLSRRCVAAVPAGGTAAATSPLTRPASRQYPPDGLLRATPAGRRDRVGGRWRRTCSMRLTRTSSGSRRGCSGSTPRGSGSS